MPIGSTIAFYVAAVPIVAAWIAMQTTFGAHDIPAMMGAAIGAGAALIHSRLTGQKVLHTVLVFVCAGLMGCAIPGAVVSWFWPALWTTLTWHMWMIGGFLSAIAGWIVPYAILNFVANKRIEKKLHALYDSATNHFLDPLIRSVPLSLLEGKVPTTETPKQRADETLINLGKCEQCGQFGIPVGYDFCIKCKYSRAGKSTQ